MRLRSSPAEVSALIVSCLFLTDSIVGCRCGHGCIPFRRTQRFPNCAFCSPSPPSLPTNLTFLLQSHGQRQQSLAIHPNPPPVFAFLAHLPVLPNENLHHRRERCNLLWDSFDRRGLGAVLVYGHGGVQRTTDVLLSKEEEGVLLKRAEEIKNGSKGRKRLMC